MITNRKENKCPCCGATLTESLEINIEVDDTGIVRRVMYECDHCHTTVFGRENYALCDIEQTNFV